MEALAAIGLASSIITFIDSGAKIISMAQQIQSSYSGVTEENAHLTLYAQRIKEQTGVLLKSPIAPDPFEAGLIQRANECVDLSEDLHHLLEKLKSAKPGSKTATLKAMRRNLVKKNKKNVLKQRLDNCRRQLELQLVAVEGSKTMRCLNELIVSGASRDQELHLLTETMEALCLGMKTLELSTEARKPLQTLLERSDEAISTILQHKVLKFLETDRLTERFDEVEKAHAATYSWLFKDQNDVWPEDFNYERQLEAKTTLKTWLLEGQGIFHISGKPGAGKSTLMKLLCDHPTTEQCLKTWASGKDLVIAKFFFWKLGTKMQKSIKGLERGLLHSALSQSTELLRKLFPQQWASIRQHNSIHISNEDIEKAFGILVNTRSGSRSHKFVFFIDGLDELEGDHENLIRQLFNWTSLNTQNLKICVSSREWLVFKERLSNCPKLRLHEITYNDITNYIRGQLAENKEFISSLDRESVQGLASEIIRRAEGVFLWAKIVFRNLQVGLLVGDHIQVLRKRILEFPSELNDLYQSVLDAIENKSSPLDRVNAMRTFYLEKEMKQYGTPTPNSLFVYSFLDQYCEDPNFAMKMPLRTMTDKELSEVQCRANKQLTLRCMGLLEQFSFDPGDGSDYPCYHGKRLKFVHSSMNDFLNQSHIQRSLEANLCEFNWADFCVQGWIAAAKSIHPLIEGYRPRNLLYCCLENFVWLCHSDLLSPMGRVTQALYTFANVLEQHGISLIETGRDFYTQTFRRNLYQQSPCNPTETIDIIAVNEGWYELFLAGDSLIVQRRQDLRVLRLMEALLNAVMLEPPSSYLQDRPKEILLALSNCLEQYISPTSPMISCGEESFWEALIMQLLDSYFSHRKMKLIEPAIRLLLLYGADPRLQFRLQPWEDDEKTGYNVVMRVVTDGREREGTLFIKGSWLLEISRKHDGVLDLRQLVELWFPGRRAKTLQILIDHNLKRGRPPTREEVDELKADRSLDLDAREGLTFEGYNIWLAYE